jgi:hypothetical protein
MLWVGGIGKGCRYWVFQYLQLLGFRIPIVRGLGISSQPDDLNLEPLTRWMVLTSNRCWVGIGCLVW